MEDNTQQSSNMEMCVSPDADAAKNVCPDADAAMNIGSPAVAAQEDLGSIIWEQLKDKQYESALETIKEEKYKEYLVHNSLDLVPVLTRLLNEDLELEGEECLEELLNHVATVAYPKEAVIVFLEELEMRTSEKQFRVILRPIKTVLMRQVTEKTRPTTFSWVFNTIYTRVVLMELPTGYNLEGKERLLLDMDPRVQSLVGALRCVKDFYLDFYTKVMAGELQWGGKVENSREYLARFLLQLFHKPITYLDIYCEEGKTESSLYRICSDLSIMISHLMGNPFKLFSHVSWKWSKTVKATDEENPGEMEDKETSKITSDKEEGEEEKESEIDGKGEISQLSLASYFYCILGQHMASEFVPCIYSHEYVYLSSLPLVVNLLQDKEALPIHKGLVLAKTLLANIAERSLAFGTLEAKAHSSFPQVLLRVMITCNNKEIRMLALEIFRPFLRKFDAAGRAMLIRSLLSTVRHAGALGLVIHELKENICETLKHTDIEPSFSGKNLVELLHLACYLPDGERTDLLEWSDLIMQVLNLLIFIFIRDKLDVLDVKQAVPKLEEAFLTPIQKGLDLSRGHYELKLKDVAKPKKERMTTEVTVSGMTLPNIPPEQEKRVVQSALCTFDMMQCALSRVHQSMEGKA